MAHVTTTKRQILDTAAKLFFRDGYRAVGIDTIVAESGVAKMTLYRHFASKDELISTYLDEVNVQFWQMFDQSIARAEGNPGRQIVAFFTDLQEWSKSPECHGCPFLNAAVDFPEIEHPGHRISLDHKKTAQRRFHELAQALGAKDPAALADHLVLLMDGVFMAIRLYGPDNPGRSVVAAVETLLKAAVS